MDQIFPQESGITTKHRSELMHQNSLLIWFTGLSGSGKSTLASALELYLFGKGYKVYLLDGDNLRRGINNDLGFSESDRRENIRRAGEISMLMLDAGLIVISAFISPFNSERQFIRDRLGKDKFVEIYVQCPLSVCEERDVKGLYKKARKGIIPEFTGISSPYEIPENPEIIVRTFKESISESLQKIIESVEPLILYSNA
jgi:adenylyl-sulfate kinase